MFFFQTENSGYMKSLRTIFALAHFDFVARINWELMVVFAFKNVTGGDKIFLEIRGRKN